MMEATNVSDFPILVARTLDKLKEKRGAIARLTRTIGKTHTTIYAWKNALYQPNDADRLHFIEASSSILIEIRAEKEQFASVVSELEDQIANG